MMISDSGLLFWGHPVFQKSTTCLKGYFISFETP